MRTMPTGFLVPTLAGCVLWAALVAPVLGQGSGSSRVGQPTNRQPPPNYRQPYNPPAQPQPGAPPPRMIVPRPPTTEEFARSLWDFLVRPQSPYTQWMPLPGKEGFRGVPGPHGPSVRLYANAVAQGDPKGLPVTSILVLEDYAADRKTRTGINILYRVQGYDPKNGDWYWMKYLENGTLVRAQPGEGGLPLAGRVTACIDCHRKAGGNDFVFSNDPTAKPEEKPEEKKAEGKKKDQGRAGDDREGSALDGRR